METEYTVSTGTKIFYYCIALVFAGFAVFIFSRQGNAGPQVAFFALGIFMIMPALLIFNVSTKKLTIGEDFIKISTLISTKQMQFSEIKGYRIIVNKSSRSVVFQSNNSDAKLTVSSITDLDGDKGLLEWIAANFTDLDAVDVQDEKAAILQDTRLGATSEEREATLKQAKTKTIVFAALAGIIGFMNVFYDGKIWAGLDVIYPFLGVLLMFTSKGLIKFITNSKRSVYPNIFIGMLILAFACFFKAISTGEIYDGDNLIKPALLLTAITAAGIGFTGMTKSVPMAGQIIFIILISGLYGFGNTLHINKVFDDSPAQIYQARIDVKTISRGKHTSYDLHLSPWGPENKLITVDVGMSMYQNTRVGDTVNLYLKKGALNIPWYQVGRK